MSLHTTSSIEIPAGLVEAIRSFPTTRAVEHCDETFAVSPFEFYATCPRCRTQIKLRGFSAHDEVADVFDAVLEWINQPGAEEIAQTRREALNEDE